MQLVKALQYQSEFFSFKPHFKLNHALGLNFITKQQMTFGLSFK